MVRVYTPLFRNFGWKVLRRSNVAKKMIFSVFIPLLPAHRQSSGRRANNTRPQAHVLTPRTQSALLIVLLNVSFPHIAANAKAKQAHASPSYPAMQWTRARPPQPST